MQVPVLHQRGLFVQWRVVSTETGTDNKCQWDAHQQMRHLCQPHFQVSGSTADEVLEKL